MTSPALSPAGQSAPACDKILFVDDEPYVLEGLRRALFSDFNTEMAEGPEQGLVKLRNNGPFAVVVSDMRMPVMDGARFLSHARQIAPDTVRVMLTGYADLDSAMRAVNEGSIYRFLNKPIAPDDLKQTLRTCLTQYQLLCSERELLESTLAGAVRVLSEVLALANPVAFSKGLRLRDYVKHITGKLQIRNGWQFEIAAVLSQLGCITFTPELLEAVHTGKQLSPEERQRFDRHPMITHDLLGSIPRLEVVAEMILQQGAETGGPAAEPASSDPDTARLGAQMIRVAVAFDDLLGSGIDQERAIAALRDNSAQYPAEISSALQDFKRSSQLEPCEVNIADLRVGMVLREDLRTNKGKLLVAKGQEITNATARAIHNFLETGAIRGVLQVLAPRA